MSVEYKERMKGEDNPNYRDAAKKTCQTCGKEYFSYTKTSKFCSHNCYATSEGFIARNNEYIMKGSRYNAIDKNQDEIIDGLRKAGVSVLVTAAIGKGFPDIIAGRAGKNYLIEIKNPNNRYGKKGLSKSQYIFNEQWAGEKVYVVYTVDDALKVVGLFK